MKHTLEEEAHSYAESRSSGSAYPAFYQGFIAGAEWKEKQSPWISVKERLPEKDGDYIVTDGNIIIVAYFFKCWGKFARYKKYPYAFYEDYIKLYMPIPTFDEILEANRDVLERMKEKGD